MPDVVRRPLPQCVSIRAHAEEAVQEVPVEH